MIALPQIALSIVQPWPYAILHLGKDVENRNWKPWNPGLKFRGPCLLHAGKGLYKDDLDYLISVYPDHDWSQPMPRGGIIGMAEIVDVVREMNSPWFFGPVGLVLRNARPLPFVQCKGQLGFFKPQIDLAALATQTA